MKPVKRLEIVIDAAHTPALLRTVMEAGARGYTLIRDVQGMGDRGERSGDQLTDVFRNCYVLIACEPDQAERIVQQVRPLLERYGGMCLQSDAAWVKH